MKEMKIIRKSCLEGAQEAEGLAVIIDVFRAFSCQPLFFHFGVDRVILEADEEKAREIKRENPGFVLVGEVNEVPIEEGDMGNSPSEAILKGENFFKNRTVIHRTTAGVAGVSMACGKAEEVLPGSFVMAGAIARYINERKPELVTLVGMGERGREKAPEDEACADYLEHLLLGIPYDPVPAFREVVFQPTAQKFIRGSKDYLPREDPIFCMQRNLFDFVLVAQREGNELTVRRMDKIGR